MRILDVATLQIGYPTDEKLSKNAVDSFGQYAYLYYRTIEGCDILLSVTVGLTKNNATRTILS